MDVSTREQWIEIVKQTIEHFEPMVTNVIVLAKSI
jgi:hypothetical protein